MNASDDQSKEVALEKPILEQILEEMFARLEATEGFGLPVIEGLKRAAEKGQLKRPAEVAKILKETSGGTSETT